MKKKHRLIETRQELLGRRIIKIDDIITEAFASQVVSDIRYLSQVSTDPIFLAIRSLGGNIVEGERIIDAIKNSKAKIIGIARAKQVASVAAYVFEACHIRVIEKSSILLLHIMWADIEFTIRVTPETKLDDVTSIIKTHVREYRQKMREKQLEVYRSYEHRIGSKLSTLETKRLYLSNQAISATRALELGLADKIVPRFISRNPALVLK